MIRPLPELSVLLLCLVAATAAPATGTQGMTLEVGEKAPDFALEDLDGTVHSLSEATGESPVVVIFFRGAW